MSNRHAYATHRRDQTRLRGLHAVDEPPLPPGPALGLAGLDLPTTAAAAAPPVVPQRSEGVHARAVVAAVDCEAETSRVDDWRIAVGKVLAAAGWPAGTTLDAHVDVTKRRVWLRRPHQPAATCDCDCPPRADAAGDPRPPIPGVDAVMDAAVAVQSRNRVKLPANLLKLLGATCNDGRITATTVADLDAVLLIDAGEHLRHLLPDLTTPAASATPANVVQLHPTS